MVLFYLQMNARSTWRILTPKQRIGKLMMFLGLATCLMDVSLQRPLKKLGVIETGTAIANVTFGGKDGRDLYMTSHSFLARTRTKIKGHGF